MAGIGTGIILVVFPDDNDTPLLPVECGILFVVVFRARIGDAVATSPVGSAIGSDRSAVGIIPSTIIRGSAGPVSERAAKL